MLANSRYVYNVAYGQYAGFGTPTNAAVELSERKTKAIGKTVANYAAVNVPLIYREEFTLLVLLACLVFAIGAWSLQKSLSPLTAYLALYAGRHLGVPLLGSPLLAARDAVHDRNPVFRNSGKSVREFRKP